MRPPKLEPSVNKSLDSKAETKRKGDLAFAFGAVMCVLWTAQAKDGLLRYAGPFWMMIVPVPILLLGFFFSPSQDTKETRFRRLLCPSPNLIFVARTVAVTGGVWWFLRRYGLEFWEL